MKIAIIAPTSIPSRRANTLQVMKMAQAFARHDHDVRMAIPEDNPVVEPGNRDWDSLAYHYGLNTRFRMEWLPAQPRLRKYDYAWYAVRWARQWKADVIFTRLPQTAAAASLLGITSILEVHDFPQGVLGPLLFRLFVQGNGARRLIVITNPLAADLRDTFGSRIQPQFMQVIPDGVDLDRYTDLPEPEESRRRLISEFELQGDKLESRFLPDRFTAGYSGHLYPGRGTSLLLEIAKNLQQVNFLIVGGEPEDVARVQGKAQEDNLQNITFTGFIPNTDLPRYQSACDVLLMPYQRQVSASSGGNIAKYLSPMKLFEYLACGRAICASDLPVFREVLSAETAVLLPPDQAGSWVSAIQDLIENPTLRQELAVNSRAAADKYTWEQRADKILAGI